MPPSSKTVRFPEDVIEKDESKPQESNDSPKKRIVNELLRRKPPFQKYRLDSSKANNSDPPPSIKDSHRPNLQKLSIAELKQLLEKQEQILKNKKLLQNLKDKGAKAESFRCEIKDELEKRQKDLEKSVQETEILFEKLSVNSNKNDGDSPSKIDEYSKNRTRLMDQNAQLKRFNRPIKLETTIKVESRRQEIMNKEVPIKIELPRAIKTLNYQQSLKQLEMATKKEKEKLRDQMLQFYTYRTRDDEPESDNDDSELDSDDDEEYYKNENDP